MRSVLLIALFAVSGCIGRAPDPGEGEGEGADEDCDIGTLRASSTTFYITTCLLEARGPTADNPNFHFVAGDPFELTIAAFNEVTTPATLDETNSGGFGHFSNDGLQWDIFSGGIGGQPVGQATLILKRIDGTDIDGSLEGVAVPGAENDTLDSVFLSLDF